MARKITTQQKAQTLKEKKKPSLKPVAVWLFFCAFMVFAMAVIGAITRLTESGLSIVEWQPIAGALPPLNPAEWEAAFKAYKSSPQYKLVNYGMELAEFKKIFFWEWLHRFWGRAIGVVYAVPLLFFWARLPQEKRGSALFILFLGAAQGALGWWMVKSGLVKDPAVSHYRLAAHLMLAVFIYSCLFRLGLSIGLRKADDAAKLTGLRGLVFGTLVMAVLTMTWGAFTAGLDAGLVYNDTFPRMGRTYWPQEMFEFKPMWKAFVAEHATVQFTHRVLAVITLLKVILLITKAMPFNPPPRLRRLFTALGVIALGQVGLGVATILTKVHVHVAATHQAGALLLLTVLLWLRHEIPHIVKEK